MCVRIAHGPALNVPRWLTVHPASRMQQWQLIIFATAIAMPPIRMHITTLATWHVPLAHSYHTLMSIAPNVLIYVKHAHLMHHTVYPVMIAICIIMPVLPNAHLGTMELLISHASPVHLPPLPSVQSHSHSLLRSIFRIISMLCLLNSIRKSAYKNKYNKYSKSALRSRVGSFLRLI